MGIVQQHDTACGEPIHGLAEAVHAIATVNDDEVVRSAGLMNAPAITAVAVQFDKEQSRICGKLRLELVMPRSIVFNRDSAANVPRKKKRGIA